MISPLSKQKLPKTPLQQIFKIFNFNFQPTYHSCQKKGEGVPTMFYISAMLPKDVDYENMEPWIFIQFYLIQQFNGDI